MEARLTVEAQVEIRWRFLRKTVPQVIFMLMSNEQGSKRAAQVDFTRSGWQQFAKLNRKLGARFLRGFVLRYELAAYLTAHEAAGTELDPKYASVIVERFRLHQDGDASQIKCQRGGKELTYEDAFREANPDK